MEVQELEKKIEVLEARLSRLEKIEKKRETTKLARLLIKAVIIITIVISLWITYNNINEKYIKPYKSTIDEIKEDYDNIKNNSLNLDKIINKKNN